MHFYVFFFVIVVGKNAFYKIFININSFSLDL